MTTRHEQIFGLFYLALGCGLVVWAAAMGEWLVALNAGLLWPLVYGAARKIQQLEAKVQRLEDELAKCVTLPELVQHVKLNTFGLRTAIRDDASWLRGVQH